MPYVLHLAEQMPDEETTVVALLHEEVEETTYTIGNLRTLRFPENVLEAIALMPHDKTVPYMEYVEKIKKNRIAAVVKRADLIHNSDLSRLEKYKQAIDILDNQ